MVYSFMIWFTQCLHLLIVISNLPINNVGQFLVMMNFSKFLLTCYIKLNSNWGARKYNFLQLPEGCHNNEFQFHYFNAWLLFIFLIYKVQCIHKIRVLECFNCNYTFNRSATYKIFWRLCYITLIWQWNFSI